MTIKFGWGWKVALLYSSFVAMMVLLVIASTRQKFDLVSKEYYKDEIAFQEVIDGSRHQAGLSGALSVSAGSAIIKIEFPGEFSGRAINGNIMFYSPVSKDWDRTFPITTQNNVMTIERASLMRTIYKMKIAYSVDGKTYYQENEINLSR